jgi:hypothetical protein
LGFIILAKRQDFNRLALAFRLCFLSPLHLALLLEHGNLRLAETPQLSYASYRLFIWHSFWNLVIYALLRFHSLTLRGGIFTIVFGKEKVSTSPAPQMVQGSSSPLGSVQPGPTRCKWRLLVLDRKGSRPARPHGVKMCEGLHHPLGFVQPGPTG